MGYSISEVATHLNLTTYTIRYYDKLGLLPKLQRDTNGKRMFTQEDLDRLGVIKCLKETGMSISDMKRFIDLYAQDHSDAEQKKKMISQQKEMLEEKVAYLKHCIDQSNFKLWFYDHMVIDGIEPEYSDEAYHEWKNKYEEFKKKQ